MRSPLLVSLALASMALSFTTATGCYNVSGDCNLINCGSGGAAGATTGTSGGGTGGTGAGTPEGCVPKDASGPVADGCGIFVATSGGDNGLGTKASPVQTLKAAIARAKDGEKRVYACAETFDETVTVDADVTIFGGLDCSKDWSYSPTIRTLFTAPPDSIPLHVVTGAGLRMEDVDVTAADAVSPGGSSIAIIAESMAVLDLSRAAINSGVPSDGLDGAGFPGPAADGAKGVSGVGACTAGVTNTPDPPVNRCGDMLSSGGGGGDGALANGQPGQAGVPLVNNNGGTGEGITACTDGTAGADGMDGIAGTGASGLGAIDGTGYTGVAGEAGEAGTPAQGGGGGGGAKGGTGAGKCANAAQAGGASGGTGGSGGCGGEGAAGGGPAGSSIGIVSLGATLLFSEVTITAKKGGRGGNGGKGQGGGIGGSGGSGGSVPNGSVLKFGCAGGAGGTGGKGGNGGGGLGGHSIGIAHVGALPDTTGAAIFVASPGDGGTGDGVSDTTNGAKGVAVETQAF